MKRVLNTGHLYCGAGGDTTGMEIALERHGLKHKGIAINHWRVAVNTMQANHLDVDTRCMSIEEAVPEELVPDGELDILWASPSCTHHSRALGGRPRLNQLRAQPELVLTWADRLFIRRITIENVPEFVNWGPLGRDGRPIKRQEGACFRAWIAALEARNYEVEWKILNCADFGDATTRKRFFLKAVRKGCGKIHWPEPTHAKNPEPDLWGHCLKRWRGIGECLDLRDLGKSIFNRKAPLAWNTLQRIAVGLRRFDGIDFQMDFLGSGCGDESRVRLLSDPIPPQHAGGNRTAVVRPFIVRLNRNGDAEDLDDPISTVTAGGQHHALCTPFIVRANKGCYAESIDEPLSSQQASTVHHAFCQPLVIDHFRNGEATDGSEPIGALTTHDRYSVVTPLVLGQQSKAAARPIDEPCPTIATGGAIQLATPVIVYDEKDVAGLPRLPDGRYLDIRLRMLKPSELAAAHSFPPDYVLTGTKTEKIKQIGNSVPVMTAAALCEADLEAIA